MTGDCATNKSILQTKPLAMSIKLIANGFFVVFIYNIENDSRIFLKIHGVLNTSMIRLNK